MNLLYLNPAWQISEVGQAAYVASCEGELRHFHRAIYGTLFERLLAGESAVAAGGHLKSKHSARAIGRAINTLASAGILCIPKPRREAASVEILSVGSDLVQTAASAFRSLGITVSDTPALRFVLATDYLDPVIEEINRDALRRSLPWMLVRPAGRIQWIGPLFIPGRTACSRCLAVRLRCNIWNATASEELPLHATATQNLAVVEAARWLHTGRNPGLEGHLWTLDTASLKTRRHAIPCFPQCAACGEPWTPRKTWILSPPAVSLQRQASSLSGICSPPRKLPAPAGLSIYGTELTSVLRHSPDGGVSFAERGVAGGKSLDPDAARLACLAEAVERYSIQFHGDEPRIRATYRSLAPQAVPMHALLLDSDRLPKRDRTIEWVLGSSLSTHEDRYVPAAFCYLDYLVPGAKADSSGCAAGTTFEDAAVHAFLELVERDAVAIWWYNRVCRPQWNLDRTGSASIARLREIFLQSGRSVHVLDITTDLGIPAMVAVAPRTGTHDILLGSAAAFTAEEAIQHALLEAAVFLSCRESQGPTPAFRRWRRTARIGQHPHLRPFGTHTRGHVAQPAKDSAAARLAWCVERAHRADLEVIAIDLTRPEIGLPVVRVVAPGMRPWRPAFAPGRLYDIPVKLGWRRAPTAPAALNPLAFIF